MLGSFGGGTYKRVKLRAYFKSNHELASSSSLRAPGREGWHTALELSWRMPPFGNQTVGSSWPVRSCAWGLSEMNQMVFLAKLADVLAVRSDLKILHVNVELWEFSFWGF